MIPYLYTIDKNNITVVQTHEVLITHELPQEQAALMAHFRSRVVMLSSVATQRTRPIHWHPSRYF